VPRRPVIRPSVLPALFRVSALVTLTLAVATCSQDGQQNEQASQTAPHTGILQAPLPSAEKPSATVPGLPRKQASPVPLGSGFDFYVLSLSWSPSYCAIEGKRADRRQCGRGGPKGFVVHGLWPQYHKGYPANCRSSEPERVPQQLLSAQRDVFPSDGLAAHEWRKHGTCSGLSQADYYKVTRMARDKVRVPRGLGGTVSAPETENAFVTANKGLTRESIAVACELNHLSEVQICFDKALNFTNCPEVDRKGCRAGRVLMPTN